MRLKLRKALEVGRSFVRPEHQRNYASLMLLWKGIGAFVVLGMSITIAGVALTLLQSH